MTKYSMEDHPYTSISPLVLSFYSGSTLRIAFFLVFLCSQYLERRECEYDKKTLVDFYNVRVFFFYCYHVSFLKWHNLCSLHLDSLNINLTGA